MLLIFAAAGAQEQQQVQPWKAPHFSIDPKALYEAASAVTAPDNADAAVLEDDESYSFDEIGRSVHTAYVIYKVLNQKGVEGWDSAQVDWEPWHQNRPSIKVRVIAADLSVHVLDPKQITEAPAREGEYKTYGHGKTLRAPFPAIALGAVVEEEFVTSETVPFFAPGHVGLVIFGRTGVPVEHSVAQFDAPSSLPLRTATMMLNGLKPRRSEADGRVTLTFEQGLLDALDTSEANLPPDVPNIPAVEFSTGVSWQSIASEYSKIVDSHAKRAEVQSIVDQLAQGKTRTVDKEGAILDYLDREIRYTGIEFDEAAIVPHDPAETLSQKYGDCKDKATLLVTMLRAAGIPAYVAVLNAGSRMDVAADLPGMGMFDHAIVYVPGDPANGQVDLWIDATDQYARLGQLPAPDQGRLALIARPETTVLVKTPESASKDNVLLELRELTLTENGPANVSEISRPMGVFEGEFRDYYADKPDKDTREGLSEYVKAQYVSDNLAKVERTDPADLRRQFELTLSCEKARRGYTDLGGAVAAIRVDSLFLRLPRELQRKDDSDEKKNGKDGLKKPRTPDYELPLPFIAEWRYRIVPPAGFIPKPLPKDTRIPLGPALVTEEFSAEKDGTVLAHLTFDSVKRRYTEAEATELRNKVAELINGSAILVNFEPQAEALLREGKVREALASYRSLVAMHPNEAVHHLQVAKLLLDAGMGEAARSEARLAVKLEPQSALAEKTLAQILKCDLVGRNLRAGSDMNGAAEAYRAAIKLDLDGHTAQSDLAILLEYDPVGRRYGRFSKMKEAIAEYQKLGQDKLADLGLANNLAFAFFYGGDYAAAYKAAQALNPEPKALIAASVAMLQGSKAGLAEANKRSNDDSSYKETARTAGEMLMNIRQYPGAADFLQAGAAGDNAAQTMGLANMLRGAQHHEDLHFANTPQDLVKRMFLSFMDPELTEAKLMALTSRNATAVMKADDPLELKKMLETGKKTNIQLARQDSSMDVSTDILMQAYDPKIEGNDATGYRVKVQIPGGSGSAFYVVKEDGQYKLLDTDEKPNAIALEILDRIKAGDLLGAKVLLDWLREDRHLEAGDDPLGGPVFPRFWIKGEAADESKMKLAAAALLANTKTTSAQGVALLEDARNKAATEREKTNIALALVSGYSLEDNYQKLLAVSSELLQQIPESKLAFVSSVEALLGLGRYDAAIRLADERLRLLDGDADALNMKMEIEATRGDYVAARGWAQKLVDQGKEDASLLNSIAWFALFTGKVEQADIATAIKSTQMARDNPAILHTLACLYAETGKTKEAHDLLLRGMDQLNLDEPNDDYWYAFGRIAEQYGERDVAIADYRKLQKPKEALEIPTSGYLLAQMRLKALGAVADAGGKYGGKLRSIRTNDDRSVLSLKPADLSVSPLVKSLTADRTACGGMWLACRHKRRTCLGLDFRSS
jgi:transglutaminase-like putative cysteine protease/predicted Zn-dependent protease